MDLAALIVLALACLAAVRDPRVTGLDSVRISLFLGWAGLILAFTAPTGVTVG